MSARIRKVVLAAMVSLTALVAALCVRNAEAFWPLSYHWYCVASTPTLVHCDFTVTNPGPAGYHYQWFFGDGSQTGRMDSSYVEYEYAVPLGQDGSFDVSLVGYASATSPSPDNFIGCTVSFGNDYGAGGGPPYSGNCQ